MAPMTTSFSFSVLMLIMACCSTIPQAKNMVLNVSEMEAKVREATNEDPW